jgi:uncharacterized membrane protein YeaQ/YmgE (transglycosylase-associated protein family)
MYNLIISLIIGGIAGWLAGLIKRGEGFGIPANILIGIGGSFVGGILFGLIGIEENNWIGNLVISTIGAVVLLFIFNLFSSNKKV